MISRIKGKILQKKELSVVLEVGAFGYEVLVPPACMSAIGEKEDQIIEFVTYHYYKVDQSKSVPVLIGFSNEVEKEFFEYFITVSGVGPKAACKALALPFSTIADAIGSGDIKVLKSLPGIGERKAKEIVAKLQDKIGKFGLIQDRHVHSIPRVKEDIKDEAVNVLIQLQYKKKEAEDMIDRAVQRNPGINTSEELLNEVYRSRSQAEITG